jgi:hypothetical protein
MKVTWTILHFVADGPLGVGLTKKSSDRFAFFLFSFQSTFESKLSKFLETKKASRIRLAFLSRQEHRIIEPDLGGVGGGLSESLNFYSYDY